MLSVTMMKSRRRRKRTGGRTSGRRSRQRLRKLREAAMGMGLEKVSGKLEEEW